MDISADNHAYLNACAAMQDDDIDLGALALAMVVPDHLGVSVDRYSRHFERNAEYVRARHDLLTDKGEDNVAVRLAALKHVIVKVRDYRIDLPTHEVLESADMMRVIDRGFGCGAALSILYMDAARKNGWRVDGLNFPNHFLMRIDYHGQRMIFDPAQKCDRLEAHDLRRIIKDELGEGAELSSTYYDGVGPREAVVHLCNYIKFRQIEMGDYAAALSMVERMRIIAPNEYRLLLDAGVLYMRINQKDQAIQALQSYVECAPDFYDRKEALMLLSELHDQ